MAIVTITLMVSMCQLRSVLISDKVGLNGNDWRAAERILKLVFARSFRALVQAGFRRSHSDGPGEACGSKSV